MITGFIPRDADDSFRLSTGAQQIVDAVYGVVDGAVGLHDADKGMFHSLRPQSDWFSYKVGPEPPRDEKRCVVDARINDRWTLVLSSRHGLHPDAEVIAKWAADKLAPYLPRSAADDDQTSPPFGGGGGSGGSAEIGIPVWWARKTRS